MAQIEIDPAESRTSLTKRLFPDGHERAGKGEEGPVVPKPQSFDDFELRLGDVMRGERATRSKSLLDVERELRIKASYIAAIENADPSAFPTPGFIPGFVRSYARYLGLDPEWAYEKFCAESGFGGVAEELGHERVGPHRRPAGTGRGANHSAASGFRVFETAQRAPLAELTPGAIGGLAVMLLLIAGIGYGGWAILREIQQVKIAPQPSDILMEMPERQQAAGIGAGLGKPGDGSQFALDAPSAPALSVGAARDVVPVAAAGIPASAYDAMSESPIAEIDPDRTGLLAPLRVAQGAERPPASRAAEMTLALGGEALAPAAEPAAPAAAEPQPPVEIVAAIPAWLRVRGEDGSVLFERILNEGESWPIPASLGKVVIRAGNGGYLYLRQGNKVFGPLGKGSRLLRDVPIELGRIAETYPVAPKLPVFFRNEGASVAENR